MVYPTQRQEAFSMGRVRAFEFFDGVGRGVGFRQRIKGAQLMFQFFSTLYQRVALIVTTNLRSAGWVQIFGDEGGGPLFCLTKTRRAL